MPDLSITLIQSPLHWVDAEANRRMFEEKIAALKGYHEIVVLPETFTTGFSMHPKKLAEPMDGESVQWMKRIAAQYRIILCGSLMIQENDLYYNRLIWMQPDGQYGYYDKAHLFSYGGENIDFTAGSKRLITSVKGWKICTMICYDLRFPVWNRMTSADEYDVLLFIANWPETRIQAWRNLLTARAIENQCFVIGLNRTGVDGNGLNYPGQSVIADPLGNLILNLEDKETADTLKLDRSVLETIRNRFPFQKDKDEFMLL